MKIIGLTGGIASGKNFVADIFSKKNAAIFDADKENHQILENDKALILKLSKLFPECFVNKKIDRKILGKIVFSDAKKLQILEEIIHPIIRKKYLNFLQEAKKSNKKLAILNIPLLLEKKGYECDYIIAILVSPSLQKRRFFSRFNNFSKKELEEKFKKIFQLQLKNKERKAAADFVVNTGISKLETIRQVEEIIKKL